MEVRARRPAQDQRSPTCSCTPTRTRCSATRRSAAPTTWRIVLAVVLALVAHSWRGRGVGADGRGRAVLRARGAGVPRSPRTWRARCTSGAATTRPRTSGSSWWSPLAVRRRVLARWVGRRHPYRPLGVALGGHRGACTSLDLVAGARLELNTVFGYSATVGIRVSGQGNITFSQLTAAVLLLGGLAVWRRPGRRTVYAVIAHARWSRCS